jgi:hypothetical protein
MNLAGQLFFGRLQLSPLLVGLMFALSTLTLLFSMIVASRLAGGIDFGSATTVTGKGAALLAVVTALNFVSFGLFLAGPVWFFGLMFLFRLDFRQTRILTRINWGMNIVWKLLILACML